MSEILPEMEKAKAGLASVKPELGPLASGEVPDFESLALKDSEAGSGTEARTPDWAVSEPFDPIGRVWSGC